MDKLPDFTRIAEKYNWEISDIKENLYRTTTPEVIVNGVLTEKIRDEETKSLKKIYRIYKFITIKNTIKYIVNIPQSLWK